MFNLKLALAAAAACIVGEADAHWSWYYHSHYYNPYWYTPVTHSYAWASNAYTGTGDTIFGGSLLKQSSNTGLTTYIKSYWSGLTTGTTYAIGY